MKPRHNPVHKRGERNVFCPQYGDCLDYAVQRAWEYWGCSECQERNNEGARPEPGLASSDWSEVFDLPLEIYK